MARLRRRRGKGLGSPFLADGYKDPAERRAAIAEEVQWYLQAQDGMEVPPGVEPSDTMPDALYWLLQVEKWGLPRTGGLIDQPYFFMKDLEAAALGRARYEQVKDYNLRQRTERRRQHGQH